MRSVDPWRARDSGQDHAVYLLSNRTQAQDCAHEPAHAAHGNRRSLGAASRRRAVRTDSSLALLAR